LGIRPNCDVLPPPEELYLWPENLQAWNLFFACQTQWRIGMGGREGLDYSGVQRVIDQQRQWRIHRRRLFADVRRMEGACLDEWAKRSKS
jgi:hypothetical protein